MYILLCIMVYSNIFRCRLFLCPMLQPTDERYIYVIIGQGERGEIPDGGEMVHRIIVWKQYQRY